MIVGVNLHHACTRGKASSNGSALSDVESCSTAHKTIIKRLILSVIMLMILCWQRFSDSDMYLIGPISALLVMQTITLGGLDLASAQLGLPLPADYVWTHKRMIDISQRCRHINVGRNQATITQVQSLNDLRSMEIPFLRPREDSAYMIPIAPSVQHRSALSPATAPPFLSISLLSTTVS